MEQKEQSCYFAEEFNSLQEDLQKGDTGLESQAKAFNITTLWKLQWPLETINTVSHGHAACTVTQQLLTWPCTLSSTEKTISHHETLHKVCEMWTVWSAQVRPRNLFLINALKYIWLFLQNKCSCDISLWLHKLAVLGWRTKYCSERNKSYRLQSYMHSSWEQVPWLNRGIYIRGDIGLCGRTKNYNT